MWVLVGDIGGSNIRLTACEVQGRKRVSLSHSFSCETASIAYAFRGGEYLFASASELFFEKGCLLSLHLPMEHMLP